MPVRHSDRPAARAGEGRHPHALSDQLW
jgi:hypothetical protein